MHRRHRLFLAALWAIFATIAAACGASGDDDDVGASPTAGEAAATSEVIEPAHITPAPDTDSAAAPIEAGTASFTVQPSVNQLHVLDAEPGTQLELVAADGASTPGDVDAHGSLLWRDIAAGLYQVRAADDPAEVSGLVEVFDATTVPDQSFYGDQTIDEGFGYVTTRDGTTLSATVWLPGPAEDGPYPTVVEYSGYSPSNPDSGTFAQLYTTLGYAYVGVNMRGTGCSGGSFEFFEPVQSTDGYDVIEVVAAQPWVAHGHVGMVGVSYPGISQLFVASTQPPSLAAITPLSVLDDSIKSTLYPGGILNTGFALAWSEQREADAEPFGQGWEQAIVDSGDTTCADNQRMRLQNTDAGQLIENNPYYSHELGDPIAPHLLVDDIDVPVFLAGTWQDEQTGGHFPAMLDDFTSSPHLYATMLNGTHTESIATLAIFERYVEFLELYVAQRTPDLTRASVIAPVLAGGLTGTSGLSLPTGTRFAGMSYDEALAAYESADPVRILFEQGAADGQEPGSPVPRFEETFAAWPVLGDVTTWYLGPGGTLDAEPPRGDVAPSSYVSDPQNVSATSFDGEQSELWLADVTYDWQPIPEGSGLGWSSSPLDVPTVVVGSGSLDLWLRSTARDTDLEVTISEVRPDGQEVYVQTGWLRASHRAIDEDRSTPTEIVRSYEESAAAPLPPDEMSLVRVEIFPFAHAFRTGSRLRVTVDAPGGARPIWAFADTLPGGETNEIAHDADHPSRLVLNVVAGIDVPPDAPPCGALRSQPCRPFVPLGGG